MRHFDPKMCRFGTRTLLVLRVGSPEPIDSRKQNPIIVAYAVVSIK